MAAATQASPQSNDLPGRGEELLNIASRLFRDRGYDATSMQEIANEMGILKGSLYHYVATKEDLLWMIVGPPLEELTENAARVFADKSLPIADRIRLAVDAHCQSFERHHPHMFVITRENGESLSKKRRQGFDALRTAYHDVWLAAVEEGIASGELSANLDPTVTVQGIFGMVNWMFRWFSPGKRLSATQVADQFSEIIVSGIAAGK